MENNKIYSFKVKSCRFFALEELTWKNDKKAEPKEGRTLIGIEDYEDKFNEIDSIGVTREDEGCRKGTKKYYDFIRLDLSYITANQKALDFLDKHNINYWKLEKPVKIVNDKDVEEKYYLIEFPEIDAVDYKLSKTKHVGNRVCEMIDDAPIDSPVYFRPEAVKEIGIFWAYCGGVICNSKTKTLLEESGLSGFEFEKQLLASEKPKEKTFVDKLLGK